MPARIGDPSPRTTRQRLAIAQLLSELSDFRSAQEIHAALCARGQSIGLATVYRNLALMAQMGDADVLNRKGGEAEYVWCSRRHHHHLVCRRCGHAIEISGPAVEGWAEESARRHGYIEVTHTLEVYGLCPDCVAADPDRCPALGLSDLRCNGQLACRPSEG